MIRQRLSYKLIFLIIALSISSCGPGELFGPTITPSPTSTLTPTITPSSTPSSTPTSTFTPTPTFTPSSTPIPGIGAPIIVNGASIRVLSAVVGDKLPEGFVFSSSNFFTPLRVEFDFSGDNIEREYNQAVVVDENGNKKGWELIETSTSGNSTPRVALYYAVKKTSSQFSILFSDGQVIDLTPILEFK